MAGQPVHTLAVEDLLPFLCVHAAKAGHRWRRLSWVADVAWLVHAHSGLDWGQVLAEARGLGCERRLLLGLRLAEDLLGAVLPDSVRQRMSADPALWARAAWAHDMLWRKAGVRPAWPKSVVDLRLLERWRDRHVFLFRSALNAIVFRQALRTPRRLAPLYRRLDRGGGGRIWLWPLPAFALFSWGYKLSLPLRRLCEGIQSAARGARRGSKKGKRTLLKPG